MSNWSGFLLLLSTSLISEAGFCHRDGYILIKLSHQELRFYWGIVTLIVVLYLGIKIVRKESVFTTKNHLFFVFFPRVRNGFFLSLKWLTFYTQNRYNLPRYTLYLELDQGFNFLGQGSIT